MTNNNKTDKNNSDCCPFFFTNFGKKLLIVIITLTASILLFLPSVKSNSEIEYTCINNMKELEVALTKLSKSGNISILGKGEKADTYPLIKNNLLKKWDFCCPKKFGCPYRVFRNKITSEIEIKCKYHGNISNAKKLSKIKLSNLDVFETIQRYIGYMLIASGIILFIFL